MKAKGEFERGPSCIRFRKVCAGHVYVLLLCLGLQSSAQTYTVLHTFGTGSDGALPWSLCGSGTTLYGTTYGGGHYDLGTVFRMNSDGSDYVLLREFAETDGAGNAGILVSGTQLYGTLTDGGTNWNGTVFKMNANGSDFSLLHTFSAGDSSGTAWTNADGAWPQNGLVLSGSALYGTTFLGGQYGFGTIFKVSTDGSGFTVLKHFGGSDGRSPGTGLIISGTTLYGTTQEGGSFGYGTVFRINTDGTGHAVLKSFAGWSASDGAVPQGELLLLDSTLYGTCNGGGAGHGTVFKINTDGTHYATIKCFNGDDGHCPAAGLVLLGSTLYGTTSGGGGANNGEIFQINPDGSGFAVVKSFAGTDGANPYGTLVADGTTLFGTTSYGGRLDCGVLFGFSLLPGPPLPDPFINTQPEAQSANAGDAVQFSVNVSGTPPLSYQWFKDGSSLSDGGGISGARTATLGLSNPFRGAAGAYWVAVSNLHGSATSHVATLSVQDPFFHTQPFNQTVFPGGTVQFAATAGGTAPLAYQWLKDGLNLSDGGNIAGAQSPTLTLTTVSNGDSGVYYLAISNTFAHLTSAPAVLNVISPPPAPGTLAVAEVSGQGGGLGIGDHLIFSFGTDSPTQYHIFDTLMLTTNDVGRLFSITEADDPDFVPLVSILRNGRIDWIGYGVGAGGMSTREYNFFWPLPPGGNGIDFQGFPIDNISLFIEKLTITNSGGGWTDYEFKGKVMVNSEPWSPPAITIPPSSQTAEAGSPVDFSVQASGLPPPSYQWYFNSAPISARTNQVLDLPNVQALNAGLYLVVVSNQFGAVTSAPAMLQVIAPVERRPVPAIDLIGDAGSLLNLDYANYVAPTPNWLLLDSVSLVSTSQFYFDITAPLPAQRYYRVWQTGAPTLRPSLILPGIVPAITLTGNIGDHLRLDYINQVGPIDSWVTLDTITLTNTSQLYFDTSVFGRPPRLYRVAPVP